MKFCYISRGENFENNAEMIVLGEKLIISVTGAEMCKSIFFVLSKKQQTVSIIMRNEGPVWESPFRKGSPSLVVV